MGEVGLFVLGAVLLLLGTDSLAKGVAAALARRQSGGYAFGVWAAGLNALLPAALIAGVAAWLGARELAVGALVGSAIAQLGLVLGLAALVAALRVRIRALAWIAPMLIGAVIL
ncbi:MAG: sodium:calcium antiporter, partial [Xanthomonadales bacterium]|nr:sodium:calcium antiporter [Xanthomonadales bacterium]